MDIKVPQVILWDKVTSTAGSRNFFVNLVSLIFMMLQYNGMDTSGTPEQVVDIIAGGDLSLILGVLIANLLNPIMKIISNAQQWDWGFVKSQNFWVQVATLLLAAIAIMGVQFPDGAAARIVNTIFGGEFGAILVAIVINFVNPLYYFFFKK